MTESESHNPRRAFAHDADPEKPIADDDTPVSMASAARRGQDSEASDLPEDAPGPDQSQATPPSNPFARPGSESAASAPATAPLVPAPAPVMPMRDDAFAQSTGSERSIDDVAGGPAAGPRRSAASSTTPPDPPTATGATATAAPHTWVQHHRKTLILLVVGALVLSLLVVLGAFLAGRSGSDPAPIPPASPSPSTSVSAVPAVSVEDLITLEDAEAIVPGASWVMERTAATREEATRRPACIGDPSDDVNPTDTFQRTMGTQENNGLAALQQVDLYADESAARQVQQERVNSLTECDEVQALIESASSVTGLGDDVTQLTVAYEDEQDSLHTVLLVRTGRALTMLDVTRGGEAVPVENAIAGLTRSLGEICGRVDGMCPSNPEATPTVPPPVDPVGWLIGADLPRIRPQYGQWQPTEPEELTSSGMGCENIPLATEPGPTERQQRTYLLTQDDQTPKEFGIDEMVFDFKDDASALVFTDKLIKNLLSCKERNKTPVVSDLGAVNGTGADGIPVSARLITIDQAISDDSSIKFQLVVAVADTRVSYLLMTVTEDYRFTKAQLTQIALRVAQRNSQG